MASYSVENILNKNRLVAEGQLARIEAKHLRQLKIIRLAVIIAPLICGGLGYLAFRFIPLLLQP